jgi:hypothetical protein
MNAALAAKDIDQLLASGGKFLRAISVKSEIMETMIGLGYSDPEHKHGWGLYLQMLGYIRAAKPPTTPIKSTNQQQALNEIDRYDEPTFRRATATLNRLHPEQCSYIFADNLAAETGIESVGSVQTFLDRYAALRDGTDPTRADKRDADKAAATTLESRNIVTPAIEQHLRALIEIVKTPSTHTTAMTVSEESLQAGAKEFADWLNDWRTAASTGITRRDFRIMLGISRRRATDVTPEPAATTPAAATPAPAPAAPAAAPAAPAATTAGRAA